MVRKLALLFCLVAFGSGVATGTPPTVATHVPIRGQSGDLWADAVIGKPAFSEITPNEVVPHKLHLTFGGGAIVDRSASPGRLYVWDGGNSRVLGIDLAACYQQGPACSADVVIGQPSGTAASSCNGDSGFQDYPARAPASAATLCGIREGTGSVTEAISMINLDVDQATGALYVPDQQNHRVLKYNSPFTTDSIADEVWGQAGFSGNTCNRGLTSPTASTVCFTVVGRPDLTLAGGAAIDPSGDLWIADSGNARVLRFAKDPSTGIISKTANLVLGQQTFSTRSTGNSLSQMEYPLAVRVGLDGDVYVADRDSTGDGTNGRVLVFEPPFTNGEPAARTLGVNTCPAGLEIDYSPGGDSNRGGLWVQDDCNSRVVLWDFAGTTIKKIIGKDDLSDGVICSGSICASLGSIGIDADGNVLVTNGRYVNDVLRFSQPLPVPNSGSIKPPDKMLFDSTWFSPNLQGPRGLGPSVTGLEVTGGANAQLIVSDGFRILFWNDPDTLNTYDAASGVIVPGAPAGDQNFTSKSPWPVGTAKSDGTRLWVAIGVFRNQIWVYDLPLTTGELPTHVMTLPIPVLGGGQIDYVSGYDVLIIQPTVGGDSVWLSFPNTNRIVRVRDPLTAPVVDVILGQTTTTGTACNRGLSSPTDNTLCRPGFVEVDRQGNLFVSDHWLEAAGNRRLLVFDKSLFLDEPTWVIIAPAAFKVFPKSASPEPATWAPAFDSCNRMVVGYNMYTSSRFPGVYDDPLGPTTTPDDYLNDFYSMGYTAVFDDQDNLYVSDLNRARVLRYDRPFDSCLDEAPKPVGGHAELPDVSVRSLDTQPPEGRPPMTVLILGVAGVLALCLVSIGAVVRATRRTRG